MTASFERVRKFDYRAQRIDLEAERRLGSVGDDLPKFEAIDQTFRAALDKEFGALGVRQVVEKPSYISEEDDEDYELPDGTHPMSA